jgi:hypothetical protein
LGRVNSSGWVRKLYNNSLLRRVGFDDRCWRRRKQRNNQINRGWKFYA